MSRIYQRLREIRISKEPFVRALAERRGQMRPGWYRIRGNVLYSIGAATPATLEMTLQFSTSPKTPSIKAFILQALEILTPPFVIRVPSNDRDHSGTATQLMISRDGDIKIFDTITRLVTTYYSKPAKLAGILKSHSTLSATLPIVAIRPTADNSGTIEPLVDGTPFGQVPFQDQIDAYKQLLAAYSAHIETTSHTYWSHDEAKAAVEQVLSLPLPGELCDSLVCNQEVVTQHLTESPMIASHGDLSISNVLISSDGVVAIDLEDASLKPFFYDLMYLRYSLARLGPSPLNDLILAGQLDSEIRKLFRAARVAPPNAQVLHWLTFLVVRLKKAMDQNVPTSADSTQMLCAPFFNIGLQW